MLYAWLRSSKGGTHKAVNADESASRFVSCVSCEATVGAPVYVPGKCRWTVGRTDLAARAATVCPALSKRCPGPPCDSCRCSLQTKHVKSKYTSFSYNTRSLPKTDSSIYARFSILTEKHSAFIVLRNQETKRAYICRLKCA